MCTLRHQTRTLRQQSRKVCAHAPPRQSAQTGTKQAGTRQDVEALIVGLLLCDGRLEDTTTWSISMESVQSTREHDLRGDGNNHAHVIHGRARMCCLLSHCISGTRVRGHQHMVARDEVKQDMRVRRVPHLRPDIRVSLRCVRRSKAYTPLEVEDRHRWHLHAHAQTHT